MFTLISRKKKMLLNKHGVMNKLKKRVKLLRMKFRNVILGKIR